jgi:hypothetical protein
MSQRELQLLALGCGTLQVEGGQLCCWWWWVRAAVAWLPSRELARRGRSLQWLRTILPLDDTAADQL